MLQRAWDAVADLLSARQKPDRYEPMWIAMPDAKASDHSDDPTTQAALQALIDDGVAVLRGNISNDECDAVVADFNEYCAQHPEHADFADEYGLHDRLANLHSTSRAARALAANARVRKIVRAAFAEREALVGSLFFEKGSAQSIHRDTPAFFTVPLNHFFGVWHALEDIHPDSGALTYYVAGHKAVPDRDFVGSGYGNIDRYFSAVREDCQSRGLALVQFTAAKGDTLIWHPQLPHGGSARTDPARSRRSIVFHYIPERSPVWGPREFFGDQDSVSPKLNMRRVPLCDDMLGLDWEGPAFIKNLKDGNFKD